tara:strand:+ start:494 stop:691 length:198 start_codon:yes stop_codon:yes gene_type:complete
MNIMEDPESELQDGVIHKKITHDYILDLYKEIKQKKISDEEQEMQLAVLSILSEHIGEFMILKCK